MPCENSGKAQCRPKTDHGPVSIPPVFVVHPLLLDDNRVQTLGVLDVDGLHVAVELLLGALLVVTPPGDADAEPVRNALDTLLPDLLVELGVHADVDGTLRAISVSLQYVTPAPVQQPCSFVSRLGDRRSVSVVERTIAWRANALSSLIAFGALFLKLTPWSWPNSQRSVHVSHPSFASHTRLCMWTVYSRATTSAMAERVAFPVGFLDDILAAAGQRALQRRSPETEEVCWIGSRCLSGGAITYLGDVWISCTRSRLSGVEESSVWLGSINLPLGNFALGFSVNSAKVRAWACSPRVTALKWNGAAALLGPAAGCG